jgi:hypothetical protein
MSSIKKIALFLFFSFCLTFKAHSMDLEVIRGNYLKAVSNKEICRSMISHLSTTEINTIQLAYLGAFQTIWAKHTANPFAKLKTFNKGKKNIESAVRAAPSELEVRLIRLSIQKNSPSFLGYNDHITEDTKLIAANSKKITSALLKKMITDLTEKK